MSTITVQTFGTFHIYRMKLFPCISPAEDIIGCVSADSSLRPEACCLVQTEEYQQMAAADCVENKALRGEVSSLGSFHLQLCLSSPYSNTPHTHI